MTPMQKQQIENLRLQGLGYARIGQALGLAKSTVKSYCQRHDVAVGAAPETGRSSLGAFCPQCGNPIIQKAGRKPRRFCTDECGKAWWKAHPEKLQRKALYNITCQSCGKEFISYGNDKRKYCSHACYIDSRFGKDERRGTPNTENIRNTGAA